MQKTKADGDQASTYSQLKRMILEGAFTQGEALVERSIAAKLNVSRTPVREATLRLEREGLVRIQGGKGAFVQTYSLEDVIEIYEIREGLEPLAARLGCHNIDPERLGFFEAEFSRYRADPGLRDEDPETWRRLGQEFHNLFIYASNNRRLIRVIEGMRDQIELFRGLGRQVHVPEGSQTAIDEHWEILCAFKARDPERAERAVRGHLQNGLKYRLEALQRGAGRPIWKPGS